MAVRRGRRPVVMLDYVGERGDLPRVHVGRALGDPPQRRRLEGSDEFMVVRLQEVEFRAAASGIAVNGSCS